MGGTARAVGHRYDANGNRIRIVHPDNSYFTYEPDGLDRPLLIARMAPIRSRPSPTTARAGASSGWAATTSYGYDPAGRLQALGLNLAGATRVLDLEDAMEALVREVASLHAQLDAAAEQQRRELDRVHRSYRRDLVIYQTPKSPVPWTFRS